MELPDMTQNWNCHVRNRSHVVESDAFKVISMKSLFVSLLALTSCALADEAADAQAGILDQSAQITGSPNTHPDAQWFPDAGLGLFIHWGIASVGATGDLSWGMLANKPWKDQTVTPNTYYAWIHQWNPDKVDYDAQLAKAKAAGFTYAVMVTKHHDGFTLWPSAYGDLGTKQHLGGRDFVKEYVDACRKHGLKVGLYYSPPDWWFDREYKSFALRGPDLDMDHEPVILTKTPADHDDKRKALVTGQVTELLTNYGKIDLIWFDGGKGEIPNTEVRRLQPGIVINRRNGDGGDYGDSEGKLPTQRPSGWFETCETSWPAGKWSYTEDWGWDSAAVTLEKLVRLRAWGANLLANVGPKADGSLPGQALSAWKEMGDWMEHSRESVIGAGPGPFPEHVNAPVTTGNGVAYVHFLPSFEGQLVWKNAPEFRKATLLRTGAPVSINYQNNELRIDLPTALRTSTVDVVKLQ
jgi:alpha-L-fucosidase